MGQAGVFPTEEAVLHRVGIGHVLPSSRLEHKVVFVSAKGFEGVELMSGIGVATAQPYKVFTGNTMTRG
jgi:hypothetical protein